MNTAKVNADRSNRTHVFTKGSGQDQDGVSVLDTRDIQDDSDASQQQQQDLDGTCQLPPVRNRLNPTQLLVKALREKFRRTDYSWHGTMDFQDLDWSAILTLIEDQRASIVEAVIQLNTYTEACRLLFGKLEGIDQTIMEAVFALFAPLRRPGNTMAMGNRSMCKFIMSDDNKTEEGRHMWG